MYKDKRPNQSDISRRSCSSRPNETDSQAQRCARLAGISGGNGGELSAEIFSRRDPACNERISLDTYSDELAARDAEFRQEARYGKWSEPANRPHGRPFNDFRVS